MGRYTRLYAEQVGDGEGLKAFKWADYKFSIGGSSTDFSKYNESDVKTVLDLEDDAAHVMMGDNWRMPTFEEYRELFENTDVYLIQTDDKEIHGTKVQDDEEDYIFQWDENPSTETFKAVKFYKKNDKRTYLLVPSSGIVFNGVFNDIEQRGLLWTSSVHFFRSNVAGGLEFKSTSVNLSIGFYRRNGIPIRGVLAPQ